MNNKTAISVLKSYISNNPQAYTNKEFNEAVCKAIDVLNTLNNSIDRKVDGYIDAIIRVKVPKWQIGEVAKVYFPDTMFISGVCEEASNIDHKCCQEKES